jgi:hypothetical protein
VIAVLASRGWSAKRDARGRPTASASGAPTRGLVAMVRQSRAIKGPLELSLKMRSRIVAFGSSSGMACVAGHPRGLVERDLALADEKASGLTGGELGVGRHVRRHSE